MARAATRFTTAAILWTPKAAINCARLCIKSKEAPSGHLNNSRSQDRARRGKLKMAESAAMAIPAAGRSKRLLTLWDLIFYGIVLIQPIARSRSSAWYRNDPTATLWTPSWLPCLP